MAIHIQETGVFRYLKIGIKRIWICCVNVWQSKKKKKKERKSYARKQLSRLEAKNLNYVSVEKNSGLLLEKVWKLSKRITTENEGYC